MVGGARLPGDLQVGGAIAGQGREGTELMSLVKVCQVCGGHAHPLQATPPAPPSCLQDTQVWLGRGRPSPERQGPARVEPSRVALSSGQSGFTCGGKKNKI